LRIGAGAAIDIYVCGDDRDAKGIEIEYSDYLKVMINVNSTILS